MHTEVYTVQYNFLKPDGYWSFGNKVDVRVDTPDDKLKTNHQKAEMIFRNKYPNARVESVTYN